MDNKQGCIASIAIPRELGEKMVVDGYEKVEDLHITLARMLYNNDYDNNEKVMRYGIISSVLKIGNPPTTGKIIGLERFSNIHKEGMDAVVALVDIEDIYTWRQDLLDVLVNNGIIVDNDYKFKPHITLAYVNENEECNIYLDRGIINTQVVFGGLEIRSNDNVFIL